MGHGYTHIFFGELASNGLVQGRSRGNHGFEMSPNNIWLFNIAMENHHF